MQFKGKRDTKGSGYWKLSPSPGILRIMRKDLANFGTTYPARTPMSRLRKVHERSQRGLLVYDVCGVGDLRQFCTARHIKLGPEMGKEKLMEKLENADDEAVFRYVAEIRRQRCECICKHQLTYCQSTLRSACGTEGLDL